MSLSFLPSRSALLALSACLLAAGAHGATRDVVDNLATLIENNYFDAAKARATAGALRAAERAGAFASVSEPRDLAVALNARLKRVDQHFNVTWVRAAPEPAPAAPQVDPSWQPFGSRNAFGFRAVEMLPGGIGYIDLRIFSSIDFKDPDDPARLAADAALRITSGAAAVILDLRNNGGGWPEMVGYLVSAFVSPDARIYNVIHSRNGTESELPARAHAAPRPDVPLYVLISGNTASAAESAAYTLQAAKRAVIVGQQSLGAANPGGEFPVGEGFNIFISTGTPFNPITGANWEGVGVKPDIPVDAEQALVRAQILALQDLLARRPGAVDMQWTLEALRAESAPQSVASISSYAGTYSGATVSASGNKLQLRRERRPAMTLSRLRGDSFFVSGEPLRRVVFERDAAGKVSGFQLLRSSGQSVWHPRQRETTR
jgi:hypothetical protein